MRYVVVDVKATCPQEPDDGFESEIIEIGAELLESDGKRVGIFDTLVRPVLGIGERCQRETGVLEGDVLRFGISLEEAIARLREWAETACFCSWGEYPMTALKSDCARKGIVYPFDQRHINVKRSFSGHYRARPESIAEAATRIGLLYVASSKTAISGALNAGSIFRKMVEDGWRPRLTSGMIWQAPDNPFGVLHFVSDDPAPFSQESMSAFINGPIAAVQDALAEDRAVPTTEDTNIPFDAE